MVSEHENFVLATKKRTQVNAYLNRVEASLASELISSSSSGQLKRKLRQACSNPKKNTANFFAQNTLLLKIKGGGSLCLMQKKTRTLT